jgi:uncharacterized lipoprotein YbaY
MKILDLLLTTVFILNSLFPIQETFTTQDSESKQAIKGEIAYFGLDALPWHSRVHIYLRTSAKGISELVTEKTILTEGEQIPIKFSLLVPEHVLRRNQTYAVCADIKILERTTFSCDKPFLFHGQNLPQNVYLRLRRVP